MAGLDTLTDMSMRFGDGATVGRRITDEPVSKREKKDKSLERKLVEGGLVATGAGYGGNAARYLVGTVKDANNGLNTEERVYQAINRGRTKTAQGLRTLGRAGVGTALVGGSAALVNRAKKKQDQ